MGPRKRSVLGNKELLIKLYSALAKKYVIMVSGQSGTGKKTLREGLWYHAPSGFVADKDKHIDTGELIRVNRRAYSPYVQERIGVIQDAGKRVDASVSAATVIVAALHRCPKDKLFIIDGSPRSIKEAQFLHPFVTNVLGKAILLIHLSTDDELALKRMKKRAIEEARGSRHVRKDTASDESMRTKIHYYHTDVLPAMKYMERRRRVVVIRIHVAKGMTRSRVLNEVLSRISQAIL